MVRSRPPSVLMTLSVLACLFAGCLGGGNGSEPDEPAAFVDPMAYQDGHDHTDYAQHQGLSWNMEELGWSPLGDTSVAWGEMDVHPDHDIGLVAFAWPTAGFATIDLSDPRDPRLLETFDLGHGYGADIKWDPSGEWAIFAIQARSTLGPPPPLIDPFAATVESGIGLYHITETGVIHDVGAWFPASPRGVHMLYTHHIAGSDYVFAAHNGYGVSVYELITGDPPVGARLVPVNAVLMWDQARSVAAPTTGGFSGAHDMTVIHDEILGKELLWVAHGYDGLWVFDVSDPKDPLWPDLPLGRWKDPDADWYMHTVQAEVLEDGTRRVVLVPEVFSDAEADIVAPVWILDATDLGEMRLLATWRNPGDHGAEMLRFSVHNFQLVDDLIVLAHYHGGVWVLEVDDHRADEGNGTVVRPLAYHVPANDPGRPPSGIYHGVYNMEDGPSVWDVVVHKGVIWATDVNSGAYALSIERWAPGDASVQSLG